MPLARGLVAAQRELGRLRAQIGDQRPHRRIVCGKYFGAPVNRGLDCRHCPAPYRRGLPAAIPS